MKRQCLILFDNINRSSYRSSYKVIIYNGGHTSLGNVSNSYNWGIVQTLVYTSQPLRVVRALLSLMASGWVGGRKKLVQAVVQKP